MKVSISSKRLAQAGCYSILDTDTSLCPYAIELSCTKTVRTAVQEDGHLDEML